MMVPTTTLTNNELHFEDILKDIINYLLWPLIFPGVFAKRPIPKRTQFGPLEGKVVRPEFLPKGSLKWLVSLHSPCQYN